MDEVLAADYDSGNITLKLAELQMESKDVCACVTPLNSRYVWGIMEIKEDKPEFWLQQHILPSASEA